MTVFKMLCLKHCCKKYVDESFASAYGDIGDSQNDSFIGDLLLPYSSLEPN